MREKRTPAEFKSEWEKFLRILKKLGNAKGQNARAVLPLIPSLDLVIDDLCDFEVLLQFEYAASQLELEIRTLLTMEIEYFNLRYQDAALLPDIDRGLEDGEVVKGSAEDLLEKIPKMFKKYLTILNELLKLLRGG